MVTLFITATEVRVMLIVVVKKRGFTAERAARKVLHRSQSGMIRGKLMEAITAKVLLET